MSAYRAYNFQNALVKGAFLREKEVIQCGEGNGQEILGSGKVCRVLQFND
ncbi:MAG: hypothetical protein NPIRA06_05180 [Nitrospirales bacterium]|nr:MAG: hypothetical protein NPIRA06_05180 [Nitrospirales bacterium]